MIVPTDPAIVGGTVAVTVAVVAWFAHTILGMRDILRDVHQAVFDHNDRPGALTRLDTHESRLNRHSDALRKIGAIDDA